jgi:metallo-beta-lactamase family protein
MHIQFFGAAGEVTGSRHCIRGETQGKPFSFLIDYGMFQGGKDADDKNLAELPLNPAEIDFVILTHAHIDHSGLLPRLYAQGFKGTIYCTHATLALLKILLLDSAHIQENDFERAERKQKLGKWRGDLPSVLYSVKQATECLALLKSYDYGQVFEPAPGIQAHFRNAGHILGSGIAVIDIQEDLSNSDHPKSKRIVSSGDLGMFDRPLMPDPDLIESADVLLIESTYGDRLHRTLQATEDELVEVINETIKHGGNIVMPAFAVGRTQEILLILLGLVRSGRLPHLNVWVDSPMATAATHLTERFLDELDEEAQDTLSWFKKHPHAIELKFVADVEESKALNRIKGGAIIISASGMCEAGRIVHHLRWNLPHSQNAIIITGFQAMGTLGRRIVDKAPMVKVMGKEVAVKASVHTIGGLSAHADQAGLLRWLKGFKKPPEKIFVIHGESHASGNFAEVIRQELGWQHVAIPERGDLFPC